MTSPIQFGIKINVDGNKDAVDRIDSVTEATDRVGTTATAAAKSMATSQKELGKTTDQLTLGQIKFLESLREQAAATGLSRTEMLKLQAAELGVTEAAKAHIQQIEAATAAQHKFSLASAGTAREMMVITHEAVVGQFKRMGGSLMVLANQAGLAQTIFSGMGLSVVGTTAAIAGLVLATRSGHEEMVAMNNALEVTSNYSGQTRNGMESLAASMTTTKEVTILTANEIVTRLVASGRIGQQAIAQVARLASDFAKVTGQDIDKIAPELIKLFSDPAKGAEELNKSMHFLTVTDQEHIATLERLGQTQEAQRLLAEKLTQHLPAQAKNIGVVTQAIHEQVDAWAKLIQKIKDYGKDKTEGQKAQDLRDTLSAYKAAGVSSKDPNYIAVEKALELQEKLEAAERKQAKASAEAAAANELQAKSWDAIKKSSQFYRAQELQDQLNLIRQNKPENDTQLAAKLDAERRVAKEIDDLYRAMGADGRKLAQERAAADERFAQERLKGQADQIQAELALGKVSKDQFDIKMTNVKLEENATKQAYERQILRIGGLTAAEELSHRNKLKLLQMEWERIEQHGANQQLIDEKKAYDEIRKAVDTLGKAEIDNLDKAIAAQKLHNAEIGKTAEQKQRERQAIEDAGTAQLQLEADALRYAAETVEMSQQFRDIYLARAAALDIEIAKRRELATLMADAGVLEAGAAAAHRVAEEWKKTANTIEHSLYDAIANGGQSASRRLKEYFAKLVLQPVIHPIAAGFASFMYPGAAQAPVPVVGPFGGAAGGGVSVPNLFSAGKTLWDGFSGAASGGIGSLFSMAGNTFGSSAVSAFGAGMGLTPSQAAAAMQAYNAAGMGSVANSIGYGQIAGAATGWIAGIGSGIGLGSMISGKYSAFGNSNISTIGGTAIGAVLGGPIGAAIGGAVGGLINRAFGMGPKEVQRFGIEGDFSSSGFAGRNFSDWHRDGGWFRGDDDGTDYSALDPAIAQTFSSTLAQLKTKAADMAKSIGLSTESIENYSKQIRLQLTNDQAENQKLITELFASIGEELAGKAADFSKFAKAGETSSVTMERLSVSLTTANTWLSVLHRQLFEVSIAGADAASKLADAFGGLDNLTHASSEFYATYYSEGERAAHTTENMTKALAAVNLSMPKTKDELRKMADSLDLNTESGRQAYALLLTLAPEFAQLVDYTARAAKETAANLVAAFTGNGDLVPVLNASSTAVESWTADLGTAATEVGYISRLFLDLQSGLISFNAAAGAAVPLLSDAQKTSLLLNDQIDTLRYNARNATINFAGLSTALEKLDMNVFVETMAAVFDSLGQRIRAVIGDIADERSAVREDALRIINPTVMSKDAIKAGIAGINTALPSNAELASAYDALQATSSVAAAAQDRLKSAQGKNDLLQQNLAQAQAQVAAANAAQAALDASAVTIYQHDGYQGASQTLGVGANGVGAVGNDELSSIRVAEGYIARLFEHANFGGRSVSYTGDASSVGNFNDLTSSIMVERLPGYVLPAVTAANAALAQAQAQVDSFGNTLANAQAAYDAVAAQQDAATTRAKQAQLAYADALQSFAIDASKSVSKLSRLREETVKYYEAQKQLADLMQNSAAGLRKTVSDYKYSQLEPEQQFAQLQTQFATAYAMALSTDGETLAGYGDKLNSLLNPLLEKAREVYGNDSAYNAFAATTIARAEAIAARLEQLTPTDYAADSLAMLNQIDATLAALDASSRSAEKLIVEAIDASRDQTVNGLRAVVAALTGKSVPAFATGGFHAGGLRIVGEYGPELEATGPARIYNADQTRAILAGGSSSDMLVEMRELRREIEYLRMEARATASNTGKTARLLDRMETDGMLVRNDADTPLHTEAV